MSTRTVILDDALYDYYRRVCVHEPDVLRRLRERTAALPEAHMQISPEQGRLMELLAKITGARRAFEVGTFTGYSALCLASALPADGKLTACDLSEQWTDIARPFWAEAGVADRIDLRIGPAARTLEALIEGGGAGGFDLGFIDADKTAYGVYYELGLELLRPGGLLLFDNVLWHGRVADPLVTDDDTEALRALNEAVFADGRVEAAMIPIGDGLTVARKR